MFTEGPIFFSIRYFSRSTGLHAQRGPAKWSNAWVQTTTRRCRSSRCSSSSGRCSLCRPGNRSRTIIAGNGVSTAKRRRSASGLSSRCAPLHNFTHPPVPPPPPLSLAAAAPLTACCCFILRTPRMEGMEPPGMVVHPSSCAGRALLHRRRPSVQFPPALETLLLVRCLDRSDAADAHRRLRHHDLLAHHARYGMPTPPATPAPPKALNL